MNLSQIFEVFSRRLENTTKLRPLTPEFRNRVMLILRDALDNSSTSQMFWEEVHKKLQYLHGKHRLSGANTNVVMADVIAFLVDCSDAHFLDFIEFALQHWSLQSAENIVKDFNQFLLVDDLPYAVTDYVWAEGMERVSTLGGGLRKVNKLTAYPQVIIRGSQATHAMAIEPALTLLKRPEFAAANAEFLDGLSDYRKGDYGDCLTKCGSAFESVMKVICDRNSWPYDPKDTADTLLKTVFANKATLEGFFKEPLMIVATLRNRLSKSHGGGTTPKKVPPNRAEYAINATAAAILLVVSECA